MIYDGCGAVALIVKGLSDVCRPGFIHLLMSCKPGGEFGISESCVVQVTQKPFSKNVKPLEEIHGGTHLQFVFINLSLVHCLDSTGETPLPCQLILKSNICQATDGQLQLLQSQYLKMIGLSVMSFSYFYFECILSQIKRNI